MITNIIGWICIIVFSLRLVLDIIDNDMKGFDRLLRVVASALVIFAVALNIFT